MDRSGLCYPNTHSLIFYFQFNSNDPTNNDYFVLFGLLKNPFFAYLELRSAVHCDFSNRVEILATYLEEGPSLIHLEN